jgi:hypothetical protein
MNTDDARIIASQIVDHLEDSLKKIRKAIEKQSKGLTVTMTMSMYEQKEEALLTALKRIDELEHIKEPELLIHIGGQKHGAYLNAHARKFVDKVAFSEINLSGTVLGSLNEVDSRARVFAEELLAICKENKQNVEITIENIRGLNKAADRYAYQLARLPWYLRWAVKSEKNGK